MSSSLLRSTIENRIAQRVESLKKGYRQNLGILGSEGIGKTRLLGELYERLGRDKDILPVYIDCQALGFADLAERWITGILASIVPSQGDLRATVSTHLEALYGSLPRTVEKIRLLRKMIRRGEKNSTALKETLSLSGTLAEETKKKVVLILDEFHGLAQLQIDDALGLLGHQIMIEKNTLYLVASSRPALALDIFHNQLSLLFSNFEAMPMSPFDVEETVQFLESRFPGLLLTQAQKKFLIRLSGGVPLYLDLLLEHLDVPRHTSGERPHEALASAIPDEWLLKAVEKELFEDYGRLSQIFQRRLERPFAAVKDAAYSYRILIAVSEGARKVSTIAAHTERKTAECKKILQRLVQDEMLSRHNDFYFIEDELFAFWIREVFSAKKRRAFPLTDGFAEFRSQLKRSLEQADLEGPETVLARIEVLMKSFRNESLQIGRKKYRMPHFNEVTLRPAGRTCAFRAGGGASHWHGRIAFEPVHEEDILLLAEETRKTAKAGRMRLMIALAGIDQNAKLMAQEAGISVWLPEDLNRLLLLYNLPRTTGIRKLDGSTLGALAQSIHPA